MFKCNRITTRLPCIVKNFRVFFRKEEKTFQYLRKWAVGVHRIKKKIFLYLSFVIKEGRADKWLCVGL